VPAPEIWGHAIRIANHFDLYERAVFSTHVTAMTWDDTAKHWVIETDRGDRMTATYLAMGTGPLNRPKLPGIPGLESFAGHPFHTARWDYAYTGGTYEGAPMTGLADKRVGIIGTGATAVQCVPPLGRDAKELFVFQRTPSAIDERNNHPIDPAWYSTLQPGWQREWLLNFATLQAGGFADEDLVKDGWTDISQRIRDRMVELHDGNPEMDAEAFVAAYEDSDDERTEQIRRRVDSIVADPETADGLKAWYRQLCKRPCFHDEYLQTFNRPNVHLVDTDGKGVERIDETGVWAAGRHYELDCIVFASGFEVNTDYTHRSSFEVVGRDGLTLTQKWSDGMESYHGMHVRGFPNMFIIGFSQGANLIANITSNYTEAGTTLAAILRHAEAIGAREVECSADAERHWVQAIEDAPRGLAGGPDCTPGYYNNEGQPEGRRHKLNMGGYPAGPVAFFHYIDDWRTSGDFEGLEFDRHDHHAPSMAFL
jgi:cation diffusion facilitator CzcD-associated flavoprotein CzcO